MIFGANRPTQGKMKIKGKDVDVKKPFDGDELLARVSAALRRAGQNAATSASAAQPSAAADISEGRDFSFASFRVDANRLKLIDARGRVKDLFINEYKILSHLARRPGEVVSRDDLLKVLWEGEAYFGTTHSIDPAICRLRAKLGLNRSDNLIKVSHESLIPVQNRNVSRTDVDIADMLSEFVKNRDFLCTVINNDFRHNNLPPNNS